jgi:hypothetical protein
MEDLIAAVGEVAAADAAFTQWIEGEDSEPKDADAVGKRLRVALDTLIARWRECEASEHKHVEMAVQSVLLLAAERERAGHSKESAKRGAIIDVVEAVKRLQTPGNEDYR